MSIIKIIFFMVPLVLAYTTINAQEIKYKRTDSTKYASDYNGAKGSNTKYNFANYKCWNGTKTECENYKDSNGDGVGDGPKTDCANFASQSLIDGGLNFSGFPGTINIGKGDKKRTKGIISVSQLLSSLKNAACFEIITGAIKT